MTFDINNITGREPLSDYSWQFEVDRLLDWLLDKNSQVRAFCFDLVMSAAYIDATSGIENSIEQCDEIVGEYNVHIGFINLCAPCYVNKGKWTYQKAVKPQSGALGKLSSEVILRFVEKLYPNLSEVTSVGGTQSIDAVLRHQNGLIVLAEVKSAPLLTYPFLFQAPKSCLKEIHEKLVITRSQLIACQSAIFLHNVGAIPLGRMADEAWPFKPLVDFITDKNNDEFVQLCISEWVFARDAYANKDRQNKMYYLANASGSPPKIAKDQDGWPKKESISDSKTSAGMDRTDDIKKGIYQSLKIGIQVRGNSNIKTAIISNLPAYRHGQDYVIPFVDLLWGSDRDLLDREDGQRYLGEDSLRRVFDFIITIDDPILRDINL